MKKPDRKSAFHVVAGKPWLDPDCPVCRAHGIPAQELFPEGAREDDGLLIIEVESLDPYRRCGCPLCASMHR